MIEINKLNKFFGKHQVLFDIDLQIQEGLITAIGGPNGSGKTTLIKCLLGLVNYSNGIIKINKIDIQNDYKYKKAIGYMPQIGRYPDNLTIEEVFNMVIDLRGNIPNRKDELIKMFNLESSLKKQMRTLSGGTRQKVSLIIAFMFNPEILILDEPTTGLDPISSQRLKELILEEKKNNKTIIIISHILSEIEELSDNFIYILEGKLLINNSINTILEITQQNTLEKAIAEIIKD